MSMLQNKCPFRNHSTESLRCFNKTCFAMAVSFAPGMTRDHHQATCIDREGMRRATCGFPVLLDWKGDMWNSFRTMIKHQNESWRSLTGIPSAKTALFLKVNLFEFLDWFESHKQSIELPWLSVALALSCWGQGRNVGTHHKVYQLMQETKVPGSAKAKILKCQVKRNKVL